MKFLLDANIPYSAREIFGKNHNALHVKDLKLQNASDKEIIDWAKQNKAALISRDFDFANILNFPPKDYSGIIILKTPSFYTAFEIKRVLKNFIEEINSSLIPKSTIIVEETRFRIKK